jgi:hypothetical protein
MEPLIFSFFPNVLSLSDIMDNTIKLSVKELDNILTYDIYINGDFYGTNLSEIYIISKDILQIDIEKTEINSKSHIIFDSVSI